MYSNNVIEAVIESLAKEKSRTGQIHCEFYQTFKKKLTTILSKLFPKIESEECN
jgi:hypothetical protein